MELKAKTFSTLDDNFDLRQLISVRTANGLRIGRLPDAPFNATGVFVNRAFEIEQLQCWALLASGSIISVSERAVVPIPALTESIYYLTIGFGDKMVEYEMDEQPMVRPTYSYRIETLEEIDKHYQEDKVAVMPILRFKISEGRMTIDSEYIAPCLIVATDRRLQQHCNKLTEKFMALAEHPNMEDGDCKMTLKRCVFALQRYGERNTMEDLMKMLNTVANVVDYYIMTPNLSTPVNIPAWSQYDVELWISWLYGYLDRAYGVMDKVVLENHDIDYEALKEQLRSEIWERLEPAMNQRIEEARTKISDELSAKLSDALREYVDGTFRQHLHDNLHMELTDELRQPLYDGLYKALYDALYTPQEEEEDNFMPII